MRGNRRRIAAVDAVLFLIEIAYLIMWSYSSAIRPQSIARFTNAGANSEKINFAGFAGSLLKIELMHGRLPL